MKSKLTRAVDALLKRKSPTVGDSDETGSPPKAKPTSALEPDPPYRGFSGDISQLGLKPRTSPLEDLPYQNLKNKKGR